MLKEFNTFNISNCYLSAIMNDDYSGLNDDDEIMIEKFLKEMPENYTFDFENTETNFTKDYISSLYADCVTVTVYYQE